MKYQLRPANNNLWGLNSEDKSLLIYVKNVIINLPVKTIHQGATSPAGVTTYTGYIEIETDKPFTIENGVLIIN